MSPWNLRAQAPSLLWLESHRILAEAHRRELDGLPGEDQLAQALSALPEGPARWVVDDLWAPSLLLRDVAELPPGGEAREAFFRWRFQQQLGLDQPHAVQSLLVEESLWLVSGLREDLRQAWLALSLRLGRPLASLQPRWLWLYNRLAPTLEMPGLLLSLSPTGDGRYTGTLAAWGRTLTLLRQWEDPAAPEQWAEERLAPSIAFLQREGRPPQALHLWGAGQDWPFLGMPVRRLDDSLLRVGAEAL